jgi:simple sugar transport system substrate-binding protein
VAGRVWRRRLAAIVPGVLEGEPAAPGASRRRRSPQLFSRGPLAVAVALIASGCGGTSTISRSMLPGGRDITGMPILFLVNSPSPSGWAPSLNAVKEVATITGLRVRVVYANDPDQVAAEIQTGIASHVAGMALDVYTPATDQAICAASNGGIPVVAWNSNGYGTAAAHCVLAFMGQNFVTAGRLIARYMAAHGYIKHGAQVFCPVEDPTGAYSQRRAQGVNSVLASYGARCDVVRVGYTDAGNQSIMVRYLQRHSDTNLIIALGGTPLANAPAVLKRLRRHIPVAGFDISDEVTSRIIDGIEHGALVATIDQEFYSQAFQAVMQLALYLKYGLFPSNVNTSDNGVVDNTNAGLAASLSGPYR